MTMFHGVEGGRAANCAPPRPSATDRHARSSASSPCAWIRSGLIDRAESVAHTRAERLRLAFRLAGLNPSAYSPQGQALGGPLVDAGDPRALAAILDVDEPFAIRIRHAADNLSDMRNLADAAEGLPFHRPTPARTTSGFGVRFDPFNGRPALHQGQDFAAPLGSPIYVTGSREL
jgi:murein DD-endopeptidase MepM/ murein hydrolase activator NlpD